MAKNLREDVRLPGKLIVFEGIDRSGKTTQLRLLSQRLLDEGVPIREVKFPCLDTKCGKVLAEHLATRAAVRSRRAIHLLFAANRWEMMKEIVTTLEAGTHILMDRYAFSGVAYSVGAEDLSYHWCVSADEGLVSPDLVIYLDNPANISARRSNFGDERYEEESKLERVRAVYTKFYSLPYWQNFDATQPKEALSENVYQATKNVLTTEPRRLSDTDLRFPRDAEGETVGNVHLLPPFV